MRQLNAELDELRRSLVKLRAQLGSRSPKPPHHFFETAQKNVNALKTQLSELESSMQADIAAVSADWDSTKEPFERVLVKPKRGGVSVQLVALVWVPSK